MGGRGTGKAQLLKRWRGVACFSYTCAVMGIRTCPSRGITNCGFSVLCRLCVEERRLKAQAVRRGEDWGTPVETDEQKLRLAWLPLRLTLRPAGRIYIRGEMRM